MQPISLHAFFVLGLAFGSFGTVLVERLPRGQTLFGRSQCTTCRRPLHWWELIPMMSYVFLAGRCPSCAGRIPWWYVLIETGSAFLFVFALAFTQEFGAATFLAVALWALWLLACMDARAHEVPDVLSLVLLISALAYALLANDIDVLSPLIALAFFGSQWVLSRGRMLGSGDILITAASGFLFPHWQLMVFAILLAYVCGALVCLPALLFGCRRRQDHIPFIPFWFCGTLLALILPIYPLIPDMF